MVWQLPKPRTSTHLDFFGCRCTVPLEDLFDSDLVSERLYWKGVPLKRIRLWYGIQLINNWIQFDINYNFKLLSLYCSRLLVCLVFLVVFLLRSPPYKSEKCHHFLSTTKSLDTEWIPNPRHINNISLKWHIWQFCECVYPAATNKHSDRETCCSEL